MADSVVNIASFALENLSRLPVDEVKLPSAVNYEIGSLDKKLRFMHTFLENSEGKRNNPTVKEVVSQITEVAYQAEDVIDTYIANIHNHRRRNMFEKCFHCKDHLIMLHKVDDQIKKIEAQVEGIYKNKDKFGSEGDVKSEGDVESLRGSRSKVEEHEVVGLVEESSDVIKHLMQNDKRLNFVSIIGMGGLGKTTLARKIYTMDEVKDEFPCRAWGYVSNDYRDKEFLRSLLQSMNKSSTSEYEEYWSVEQLKEAVKKGLRGKKYLVVIDDIWKRDVWDNEVEGLFPEENNGSRVLITSRLKNVAPSTGDPYQLPFLNKEDSWKLFSKQVFRGTKCLEELEPLGRTMVENCCEGLPLAIIALAELVKNKGNSVGEWSTIKETFHWQLTQHDNKRVMDILKLSYDTLRKILKPCFLYLGIYPEHHEIPVRELIQQWIAEGFVQPSATSTPPEAEVAAENYLDELMNQSLVQVASKKSDGRIKKCRIHNLLRALCISNSKANQFMEVFMGSDMEKCDSRRLSIHYKTNEFSPPTEYSLSKTRSLFLFGDGLEWDSKSKGWKWITKSLKLARVMDLYSVTFVSAPADLKTLIHLRYLKVKAKDSTIGSNILASTCKLWNLETLYLSCKECVIPSGLWNLKRLRHAYFDGGAWLERPEAEGSKELKMSLKTLHHVYVSTPLVSIMDYGFLTNLTKLTLDYGTASTQQLPSLRSLNKLRKLKLIQVKFNLPVFPLSLTKITLREFNELGPRFMNTLGELPNLRYLKLCKGSISSTVNCVTGEFPGLVAFHMENIKVHGLWTMDEGAMRSVRNPILHECYQYGGVPLKNLRPPPPSTSDDSDKVRLWV